MTAAYRPPVMTDCVIDLSHNNAIANPLASFRQAAAGGIAAIFHKATQGSGYVDPTFAARRVATASVGLKFGAYHFCDGSDPTAQADHFLSVIGDPTGLEIALDAERNASQVTVAGLVLIASRIYRRTGIWPGTYTGRSGPDGTGRGLPNATLSANTWLWLAEYGDNPVCPPGWPAWRFWQHTDGTNGSRVVPVPGIGRCDRSHFAGTIEQLRASWGVRSGSAPVDKAAPASGSVDTAAAQPNAPDYAAVQRALNAWGIDPPLVVDGVRGDDTIDALRVFQADPSVNLPVTGVADAATLTALLG